MKAGNPCLRYGAERSAKDKASYSFPLDRTGMLNI